jgi:hypothetical protein
MPLPVLLIHSIANQRMVKRARSTEDLFLRSGPVKEAPAGVYAIREVQGKRLQSALEEALRRSERGLIRNLHPCFIKLNLFVAWQHGVWGVLNLTSQAASTASRQ